MGQILSPTNGASVYQGAIVPVQYFSDLVDFDCGVSTGICFIDYKINGNLEVGAVPITQPGFAPQQQADQPLTMPLTGSTVTIDVEGRGVGGGLNDTATATLNLLPPPSVSCNPSSSPTSTSLGLSGLISSANNDVCIFRYGTTSGGPYNAGSVGPFFIDGSSIAPSGTATGLTPDTTYFYVLEFVDDYGNVIATSGECSGQTLVAPPTAACTGPAPINFTSINLAGTLSGNLPAGGSSRFRYGTNPGGPYPNTMVAAPYAVGSVGQTVTGLPPGTTYYFVLDILDSANTVVATSGECSTSTMAATASCAAPTGITASGMTLNGSINFAPVGGSVRFRYGTTSGGPYATTVAGSPFAGGPISANITGLAASTQYYYIVETLDSTSTVIATSTQCTGTTLAAAVPTASCAAATGITSTAMTLNGTIGSIPAGGSVRFRYGTVSGGPYGTTVAAGPYANGAVSANLSGLAAGTQYYYLLEVLNSSNVVVANSSQCTATTLAAPSAACSTATGITQTASTLNGTVGGLQAGGSIRFRYGTVNGGPYGTTVAAAPYAAGSVSANLTGLSSGTTYYYILEVLNSANVVLATSGQCSFTTSAVVIPPAAVCSVATGITSTAMTVSGTLSGTLPAGGSARFVYGTTSGGPYTGVSLAAPYATGSVSANITGLTPGTTYYYRLEVVNSSAVTQASSGECSASTSLVAPATAQTTKSDLVKLCTITGVTKLCDLNANATILLVTVTSSDGDVVPTDSTEFPAGAGAGIFSAIGFYRSYYADVDGNYLLVQPTSVGECTQTASANYTVSRPGCAFNSATLATQCVTIVSVYDGTNALLNTTVRDRTGAAFLSAGYTIYEGECDEYVKIIEACFTVNASPAVVRNGYKVVWNDHTTGTWTALEYIQDGPDSILPQQTFTPSQVTEKVCEREYDSSVVLCDDTGSFVRHFRVREDGTSSWVADTRLDMLTAYTPVGTVKACNEGSTGEIVLCDSTGSFIRKFIQAHDGTVSRVVNLNLDGTTHTVSGTVSVCTGADLEAVDFCMRANTAGTGYAAGDQIKLTRWFNPATNTQVSEVAFNVTQGGLPVTTPLAAANFDECSSSSSLHTVCRCDDTNGDGTPDKKYTSVVRINEDGTITTLGNYTTNLSSVYTPVAPVDCGAGTQLIAVQPRYKVLSGAGTWTLGTDSGPVVQAVSVTVLTHGGAVGLPTVTTNVGASRIYLGQTVAWSVVNDRDKIGLRTPLVITTGAGDLVAVNWSEEVV